MFRTFFLFVEANCARRGRRGAALSALLLGLFAFAAPAATAQVAGGSPDLVVSQVYTRGGEPGATFRNDYIEIFNRGTGIVNLNDYTIHITTNGTPANETVVISFVGTIGTPIAPGQYRLLQFGSSGNNGAILPVTPDSSSDFINLGSATGRIAVVKAKNFAPLGCPVGIDASVSDYVGYGLANVCAEDSPVPAPTTTTAALRQQNGCADTDNNAIDLLSGAPAPRNSTTTLNPCAPSVSPDAVQFESSQIDTNESAGSVEIFVTRGGDTTVPATVQYATIDGQSDSVAGGASDRADYTTAIGTLRFAAGETRKSFRLLITDDSLVEGLHVLRVALGSPDGNVGLGAQHTATVRITDNDATTGLPNPIDSSAFFVRQHYADFLNRDPDAAGLQFWTDQIESCGADQACREVRRINVSAAFFLSIEFQRTGLLVYRAYKAAYPDSPARPRGFPTYREFEHDAQDISRGVIIGQPGADDLIEQNRQRFFAEFVLRPGFLLRYPATLTAAQYVDALNQNAGGALSQAERDALVAGLGTGAETRATVLRKVAEDSDFAAAERNRAFVLMQYFGYMRRNPVEAPEPGLNFAGYDFWLGKLNEHGGDFVAAEMVKSFIISEEYRERFGAQ